MTLVYVQLFSKCVLYATTYLFGLGVHLLQIQCYNANKVYVTEHAKIKLAPVANFTEIR
jgi:hypothetical protein